MTRLEQDLMAYIPLWEDKPQAQVQEELASWSLETKRIPDPYYFAIRYDGKLVSPETGELVENSIERNSDLGRKEWAAFQQIQDWDRDATQGVSFWVSPPHPLRSQFTKVIASEIVYGEQEGKHLFNRSIMLELDANQAFEFHNNLSLLNGAAGDALSPEDVRSYPVFLNNADGNWIKYLNVQVQDEPILNMIRTGEDIVEKELALKNSGVIYDRLFANTNIGFDDERVKTTINEAGNINYFGSYDSTCPISAFDMLWGNSSTLETFNCPNCPYKIPSGRGITKCPGCGITKEQAGSRCG